MEFSILNKELCCRLAQSASTIIGHHVLVTNVEGIILGSDDITRNGKLHEASLEVVSTGHQAYHDAVAANSLSGTKPGTTIPLLVEGRIVGTIGITGNPKEVSRYAMLIQQLAQTFLAFQFRQRSAQYNDYEKLSLLHALVLADPGEEEGPLYDRAYMLGYDLNLLRVVLRIELEPKSPPDSGDGRIVARRITEKMETVYSDSQDLICMQNSTEVIAMPVYSEEAGGMNAICQKAQLILDDFSPFCESLRIGIGAPMSRPRDLHASYQDATLTLRALHVRGIKKGYLAVSDVFLEKMAMNLNDDTCESVSAALLRLVKKEEEKEQLLEMVSSWCQSRFNFSRTAKALNIHKSTLVYRFQRAKEKYCLDMNDIEKVMSLYMFHLRQQLRGKTDARF